MNKRIYLASNVAVAGSIITLAAFTGILLILIEAIFSYSPIIILPALLVLIIYILVAAVCIGLMKMGIEIKDNIVYLQENEGDRRQKFHINELAEIKLQNENWEDITEQKKKYKYVNIVFFLKSGRKKIYYASSLTDKQYKKVRRVLLGE